MFSFSTAQCLLCVLSSKKKKKNKTAEKLVLASLSLLKSCERHLCLILLGVPYREKESAAPEERCEDLRGIHSALPHQLRKRGTENVRRLTAKP